ncbi:MAG: hypothetical protein RL220_903, partial [Bacteroidota bacterium]
MSSRPKEFLAFSELNRALESRFSDTSLYTGSGYSFLKVVQHALSYWMLDSRNKLSADYFHLPSFLILTRYRLRALLRGRMRIPEFRKTLVLDEGRVYTTPGGEVKSMYFDKIIDAVGRGDLTHVKMGGHADLKCDHKWSDISVGAPMPCAGSRKMLNEIKDCLRRLRASGLFEERELQYIRSAFHVFFESYLVYLELFRKSKVSNVMFSVHYHKEGMIAAARDCGIRTIEIQHGLISANDFYYVYSPVFSNIREKAFFPDYILLYGPYWRDVLLKGSEWQSSQLIVVGNYLAIPEPKVDISIKENIIFIGAQKNLPGPFIEYTLWLQKLISEKGYPWRIVVKTHPLEKAIDEYRKSLIPAGVEVVGNEANLLEILSRARIQISIYSTTFYDALGLG